MKKYDIEHYNKSLFSFLTDSPTAYHATEEMRKQLLAGNFAELSERSPWHLNKGSSYFVTRNGALLAFTLAPTDSPSRGFRIIGAHADSPALVLKTRSRKSSKHYLVVGVEKYGGALLHPWFDRDLSVAGKIA